MNKEQREAKRKDIASSLMSVQEAREYLGVSRPRLYQYMDNHGLQQVVKGFYLKADIIAFKQEFDKARGNNKWLREFE